VTLSLPVTAPQEFLCSGFVAFLRVVSTFSPVTFSFIPRHA
jgi:hypothetical protein